jgi:GT2 family glycosyltransferase
MGHLRVSVIINTLDRTRQLERTLQSLRQLRYPAFEVVAVHGPCRDDTLEVLRRFAPPIRIGACPEPNLAMSRNIGVAMARGDIVAFLDDDAIPEPDWLDRLASGFADPGVGGAGGFIRDRDGVRFQHRVIVADRLGEAEKFPAMPPELGPHRYFSPTGTNVAIRREALLSIGGFDEEYAYFLDETDVNLRLVQAGWRLVSIPDAEVHHKFSESRLRSADRVPLSLYLIARSKSYFCRVNGAEVYSAEDIARELRRFQEEHRLKIERFLGRRKIDDATARRLMDEVEQGLADGARDAGSPRRLLSPTAVLEAEPFAPYPKPARDPRLRVCVASRHPWRHKATREAALELVERGHEVTVIQLGEGHAPSVEFRDGMWLHGVVPSHMPTWWPATWTAPWPTRSWFAAAVADEVRRIEPRRQLQILAGPPADIAAIEGLRRLDIPAMATTAGPLEERMVRAIALNRG